MKTFEIEIGNQKHAILAQEQDGKWWVAALPLCELLDINWKSQHKKLITSERINHGDMTTIAEDGKHRTMFCIELEDVTTWLFSINPNKVSAEIKEQLILFQKKLQLVLYTAVFGNPATAALQKEVAELRSLVSTLSTTIMTQHQTIQSLTNVVSDLQKNSGIMGRFVQHEVRTAASRMSHQRWAKKGLIQ